MRSTALALMVSAALVPPAMAQFIPSEESLEGFYRGTTYSPYAQRSFPSRVFWGDTHVHTNISLDAGMFGNTLGPDEAYRFAKGDQVTSSTGLPAKLGRPLDWLVVADHSDMMGFATDFVAGAPVIKEVEQSARWYEMFSRGGDAATEATLDLIMNFAQGSMDPALLEAYSPGASPFGSAWQQIIDTAEAHYEPGRFTTLIGYEWTSLEAGNNLHRNVILRDGARRAEQVVPMVTQPPFGSNDPLKLYEWMEDYEEQTGGQALAIAHNGNLSNGIMFPVDAQFTGRALDAFYVEQRAKWEPLYEVTQIKGDGEAHPYLSPDDEFADYETWDVANLDLSVAKTPDMLSGEYAREALKQGLGLEAEFGTNPYQFGMVGSTDTHTSLSAVEEENYFGKAPIEEPSISRALKPFGETEVGVYPGWSLVASGYAGVWATENTREAIWDAMARKEVYATTGPRMIVRFFGGWEFDENDLRSRAPAFAGYEKGVPMGADLRAAPDGAEAPTFMVYALRDPIGANLDRIQIVKGWRTPGGELQEKVYDVAWSDGREPDADGKLPPVGNTVDIEAANWTNTIGASELATVWTDPDFDPTARSFYYARVIEIPTPRWVLYDKVRLGAEIPEEATLTGQERAYTSPIWYTPET